MNYSIFDIEADGLIETATKIYCMSVTRVRDGVRDHFTLTDYGEMAWYLSQEEILVGHNIIRYDKPMLEKFLKIKMNHKLIDTLALSWYLHPYRKEHGLEPWGETLGIEKPKIDDWFNLSLETYIVRCEEDVKINTALWDIMEPHLMQIYGDWNLAFRFIMYLSFKMDCAREQEEEKWLLDVPKCEQNLLKLKDIFEQKKEALANVMPKVIKYDIKEKPKKPHKKDGSLSAIGEKWFNLLKEQGLPEYYVGAVKVPVGEEIGNPGSHQQLKAWLFSLGWKPSWYKPSVSDPTKLVPQIANRDGDDIDDSVKDLYEQAPELENLEGLFVVRHRIGILEGFLSNKDKDNYLRAQVKGLTNTLRFQHTTLVNLPQVPKPYWEEVRGCLVADEGYILCGSDMSSLEDNTKHHYMMYFDPDAVKLQRTPGFDAHINMAVVAKYISWDEGEFYKWYDKRKDGKEYNYIPYAGDKMANSITGLSFDELVALPEETKEPIIKKVKPIRLKSKKVNFAAVYGAGAPKLAETASVPLPEAKSLHTAYWIINRAVKQIAQSCKVKTIGKQMWLYNPVSKFWLSLREDKDRFSTLNQSTGVYAFDTWLKHVRSHGIKLVAQFHDEKVSRLLPHQKDEWKDKLSKSIDLTNAELKLNVPLRISMDFGLSYAEIH